MPIQALIPWIISAAAGTIANIASDAHAAKVAKRNTNLTIAENKRLAELAYAREKENISEMNKYNDPASQMERFKKAGLNPVLVAHQGTPGNQTQLARYNAPTVEYKYLPKFKASSLQPILDLPDKAVQVKNLIAQGKLTSARAKIEKALSDYSDYLASNKSELLFNQKEISKIQRIWSDQEFKSMFTLSGNNWYLKPEMSDTFIEMLVAKWLGPTKKLEETQANIVNKTTQNRLMQKQLELLEVIPWLSPLIQFLKIVK